MRDSRRAFERFKLLASHTVEGARQNFEVQRSVCSIRVIRHRETAGAEERFSNNNQLIG